MIQTFNCKCNGVTQMQSHSCFFQETITKEYPSDDRYCHMVIDGNC